MDKSSNENKKMHKTWLTFCFVFYTIIAKANDVVNEETYRMKFYASVNDANSAKKFLQELLHDRNSNQPLIQGYRAAVSMVMANHVFNPYSKFKYFIEGKNLLEEAILKDPKNIELRFIRLSIQTNAPRFLGYYHAIQEDKIFVLKHSKYLDLNKTSDKTLYNYIKTFFQTTPFLSESEKKMLAELP